MALRSPSPLRFLLRPPVEPKGFECLLPFEVRLVAHEELIPSLLGYVDPGHGDIELRAAPLATSVETPRAEVAAASEVIELVQFPVKVLHRLIEVPVPLADAFVAVVNALLALHGCDRGLVDDIGVVPSQHGVHVSPIEGLDGEANPFHPLLRHRRLSISRRGAAFHAKRIAASRPKHYSDSPAA